MNNFKLIPNNQSFQLIGAVSAAEAFKLFDRLFIVSYVFCSVLIIYSLMLFNLAWGGGNPANRTLALSDLPQSETLTMPVAPYLPQFKTVWLETAIFAESTGNILDESLDQTIQLYADGLISLFIKTGDILSSIPDILTSPPAFAKQSAPGS